MAKPVLEQVMQKLKYVFELVTHKRIKTNLLVALPFWIASLLTGLIAVGYARLFSYMEQLSAVIFRWQAWSIFLLAPICIVLAWWMVQKWAPNARGSGIPQVMAAIELATPGQNHKVDRLLGFRIILVKIASSLMMVLGGAAIGREGPTIQIAGSIFRIINKWTPAKWPKIAKRSFIMTGAAAGLAAAFNTPLGGVVFAVEELTRTHIRFFRTALFSAVIIAGLTAQGILGPYLYLGYPKVSDLRFSIFLGVILVALVAGLGGALMSKLILRVMRWRATFTRQNHAVFYVLGAALLLAAIAFFINSQILGSGKELMAHVLFTDEKHVSWHTALLRMLGIVISFSTGAAGGVFAPSLAAGAGMGAYLSGLLDLAGANANIIILSGMVGFLTGVTRTPFTSAILVLEMTDRHSVIFHLMLAALVANLAALLVDRHSFYDHLKRQYLREINVEKKEPPTDGNAAEPPDAIR